MECCKKWFLKLNSNKKIWYNLHFKDSKIIHIQFLIYTFLSLILYTVHKFTTLESKKDKNWGVKKTNKRPLRLQMIKSSKGKQVYDSFSFILHLRKKKKTLRKSTPYVW